MLDHDIPISIRWVQHPLLPFEVYKKAIKVYCTGLSRIDRLTAIRELLTRASSVTYYTDSTKPLMSVEDSYHLIDYILDLQMIDHVKRDIISFVYRDFISFVYQLLDHQTVRPIT